MFRQVKACGTLGVREVLIYRADGGDLESLVVSPHTGRRQVYTPQAMIPSFCSIVFVVSVALVGANEHGKCHQVRHFAHKMEIEGLTLEEHVTDKDRKQSTSSQGGPKSSCFASLPRHSALPLLSY